MQSGISASQELRTAFQELVSSPSKRGLLVTINKEALTPVTLLDSQSSSFNDDLSTLKSYLEPKTALYIILRRYDDSSPAPFIAITYVPDAAPVRQKMLFSSTQNTLVRELGIEHFRGKTIFASMPEELTKEGFAKHDKHVALENPLTEEERTLGEVKRQEAEEGRGAGERKRIGGAGLSMAVTDEALAALRTLSGDGGESELVQLGINVASETIELASTSTTPISALSSTISSSSPRYSFYRFVHEHNGEIQSPVIFIYTCPSGSKIKERMLYAASSRSVVQVATEEAGLKVEKRVEAGSPDEVSEQSILDDLHPKVEVKTGFARPKRPGRK